MSTENLVSITISPEDKGKIDAAVAELNTILKPLLTSLTATQRREVPKMGESKVTFVEKTLDYARSNPEFAPPYMNIPELETDIKAVEDLQSIYRPLLQLMAQLDDSIMLSGSEAHVASLAYYNTVKIGTRMNVPNAKTIYEDLKQHFSRSAASPSDETTE